MNKSSGISTENLSIKFELIPFKEKNGFDWIPLINTDQRDIRYQYPNGFALYLIDLLQSSELHNAIVQSLKLFVYGNGLTSVDPNSTLFIQKENEQGQTLNDTIKNFIFDLIVFGYGYLEVIWDKKHTKIINVEHIDASKILLGKKDEKFKINNCYYSRDWTNYRKANYAPITYNLFKTSDEDSEIMYCPFTYTPNMDYYTLPAYSGGLRAIDVDKEIIKFHLSNLKTGFIPGTVVSIVTEDQSDETKQKFRELFEYEHTSSDRAGKTVILFSSDKDAFPKIDVLNSDGMGENFLNLSTDVKSRILTSHGITSPLLVGVSVEGKLGGSSELEEAYRIYYNNRIKPMISYVERILKKITDINGIGEIIIDHEKPTEKVVEEKIIKENGN
jgi:hypothetical protein